MSTVWIYKFDGTIQCHPEYPEITLKEMRKQLSTLIGEKNIVSMKKSKLQTVEMCGIPTGAINTYEITPEGWFLLSRGIIGKCGFERLDKKAEDSQEKIILGQMIGLMTASMPVLIRDLPGYSLRVYKSGDGLSLDWNPDRFNIEIDEKQTVIKVWFG